jgi:hypothetical protein
MAIGIDGIDRSIKNIAELSFQNLDTGVVLNLPKPSSFIIDRGFQQRRVPTVDDRGNMTYSDNYIVGEDPKLQIIYAQWQPEIMAFKMGTTFETGSQDIQISKSFDVYKTGVAIPLNIGDTGITINSSKASHTVGNISVDATSLLTVDSTAKTVTFQAGLLNKRVTFQFDVTVTSGLIETANKTANHSVAATLVATDDELIFLEIPKVSVNFETSQLSPSAEQVDINFFINSVAGRCKPYDIIYSGEYISC